MVIRAELSLRLPFELSQEDDMNIASCVPLDVHSQGATAEAALANLREALQLFIETCFEAGTLDQVLKQAGFDRVVEVRADESVDASSPAAMYLDVPMHLLGRTDGENLPR